MTVFFPWPQEKIDLGISNLEKKENKSKAVKWWDYSFEIVDPIEMLVEQNGVQIKLMTYYQPTKVDRKSPAYKGIIFYIHGFADYSLRSAHVAQFFSETGYDFFSMDARGHGAS